MVELTEDEHSFRKIESGVKRAISDYGSINDGGRVLVGLPGGKGPLASVNSLGHRSKIYCPRFEVVVAYIMVMNIPHCSNREHLKSYVEEHDSSFIVHKTSFDPSTDTRKSPCFSCSQIRRKALFKIAKTHKCSRIVLGHHQDDILKTLLMSLTRRGAFGTMPPRLKIDKFDTEVIRPMCLVEEGELIQVAVWRGYRKQLKNYPRESGSSRSDMKELLRSSEAINPETRYSLWGSMTSIQEDYLP